LGEFFTLIDFNSHEPFIIVGPNVIFIFIMK
jgi:hypothetical protein